MTNEQSGGIQDESLESREHIWGRFFMFDINVNVKEATPTYIGSEIVEMKGPDRRMMNGQV